jgi:hypothetical protein
MERRTEQEKGEMDRMTNKHDNSSLSSSLSSEESDEVILFCGEQMKPYPSPGTIILTPPPPPPADPAPAFTDDAALTSAFYLPRSPSQHRAGGEPLSWPAPHYQTWRDAQTTKETNAQRRARHILLYAQTGGADPPVMYHAVVDMLRKAGPGASVKLRDVIRSILGLCDVTLRSILQSHPDVFDFRGGDSVILFASLGKKIIGSFKAPIILF